MFDVVVRTKSGIKLVVAAARPKATADKIARKHKGAFVVPS